MFQFTYIILCGLLVFSTGAHAKNLATISYSGAKGPVTVAITVKEFTNTYKSMKQIAPNTPPVRQFFQEYLRYRIGVEQAYNDKSLVKSPRIRNMFSDPMLREGFEQMLYKTLAEKKLGSRVVRMEKQAHKLSKNILLKFYRKNPEFDINFILIGFPAEPNPGQIKEAQTRAQKIYADVKKSKKPFVALVDIYSDDRIGGKLSIPRTRHNIYPTIYRQLSKMKNGQISSPIRTSTGFYIVKLNRKIPFGEANRTQLKANWFDQQRSQALTKYFNSLKSKYKVETNTALLNNIR